MIQPFSPPAIGTTQLVPSQLSLVQTAVFGKSHVQVLGTDTSNPLPTIKTHLVVMTIAAGCHLDAFSFEVKSFLAQLLRLMRICVPTICCEPLGREAVRLADAPRPRTVPNMENP